MSRATTGDPGEAHAGLHRQLVQVVEDVGHRPVQIDRNHIVVEVFVGHLRQEMCRSRSELLEERPTGVILASACRSAEQLTAIAIGALAPCRGRRITRTSWQKYCATELRPIPNSRVCSSTACSMSRSRYPLPSGPPVGRQAVVVAGRGVFWLS